MSKIVHWGSLQAQMQPDGSLILRGAVALTRTGRVSRKTANVRLSKGAVKALKEILP